MKILVFGGSGMLGHKLVQQLSPRFDLTCTLRGSFESVASTNLFERSRVIEDVDVTDLAAARRCIETTEPDVVLNAVGIIKQLPTSEDVVTTLTVNSIFPHRLAELGREYGFRLISVSTDCVFAGTKGDYRETDTPDAADLYGKSKNLGEVTSENCLTLRTSIIGREICSAHSLVEWFLGNRGGTVKGFVNAIYSGFPTLVFAGIIGDLIDRHPELSGLYHVSSDPIDKYTLLCLIRDKFDVDIEVEKETDFRIDRSLNSERFRRKVGFSPPSWDELVTAMASDRTPYDEWKRIEP